MRSKNGESAGFSNRLIRSNGHWRHRHQSSPLPHDCRFNVESWKTEMVDGSREEDVSDVLMLPPPTGLHLSKPATDMLPAFFAVFTLFASLS